MSVGRKSANQRFVLRVTAQQSVGVRQFEGVEFEARRYRTPDQREALRAIALRRKPMAGRHHELKRRVRRAQAIAEPLHGMLAMRVQSMNQQRIAGIEMPHFVRVDAMPGGVGVIVEQVVNAGGGTTRCCRASIGQSRDVFVALVGLAVEAAFRVRLQLQRFDDARDGGVSHCRGGSVEARCDFGKHTSVAPCAF